MPHVQTYNYICHKILGIFMHYSMDLSALGLRQGIGACVRYVSAYIAYSAYSAYILTLVIFIMLIMFLY